ncbi:helicase [Seminavis robusta]|uniref:Helicase n=1 Tax=Seminavis robusta TaxID=568900 RepID=A0A9N8EHB3_9STRA|nr:helicase [Seminavis robusta]|eukprot:Sro1003_g230080.1 helicase (918) ;mRNA; r:31540-34565
MNPGAGKTIDLTLGGSDADERNKSNPDGAANGSKTETQKPTIRSTINPATSNNQQGDHGDNGVVQRAEDPAIQASKGSFVVGEPCKRSTEAAVRMKQIYTAGTGGNISIVNDKNNNSNSPVPTPALSGQKRTRDEANAAHVPLVIVDGKQGDNSDTQRDSGGADNSKDSSEMEPAMKKDKAVSMEKDKAVSMEKTQIGRWVTMFERLIDYREKTGDFLVPNRYAADPQLGAWVATQRREYKLFKAGKTKNKLTPDRVQRLSDIGFDWEGTDPRHAPWDYRYKELCDFVEKHGHAQVPARCVSVFPSIQRCLFRFGCHMIPNFSNPRLLLHPTLLPMARWKSLSNWISKQRHDYKLRQKGASQRLSDERMRKLEAIGFQWDPNKLVERPEAFGDENSPKEIIDKTELNSKPAPAMPDEQSVNTQPIAQTIIKPSVAVAEFKERAESRMGPANGAAIEPPDFEIDQGFGAPGADLPGVFGAKQAVMNGVSDLKAIQTTLTASALVADPNELMEAASRNHSMLLRMGLFPNGVIGSATYRAVPGGLLTLPVPVTNNIAFIPVLQNVSGTQVQAASSVARGNAGLANLPPAATATLPNVPVKVAAGIPSAGTDMGPRHGANAVFAVGAQAKVSVIQPSDSSDVHGEATQSKVPPASDSRSLRASSVNVLVERVPGGDSNNRKNDSWERSNQLRESMAPEIEAEVDAILAGSPGSDLPSQSASVSFAGTGGFVERDAVETKVTRQVDASLETHHGSFESSARESAGPSTQRKDTGTRVETHGSRVYEEAQALVGGTRLRQEPSVEVHRGGFEEESRRLMSGNTEQNDNPPEDFDYGGEGGQLTSTEESSVLPHVPLADDLRELRELIKIVQRGVEPETRRPQHDPPPYDNLIESIRSGRRRPTDEDVFQQGRRARRSDPPEG